MTLNKPIFLIINIAFVAVELKTRLLWLRRKTLLGSKTHSVEISQKCGQNFIINNFAEGFQLLCVSSSKPDDESVCIHQ